MAHLTDPKMKACVEACTQCYQMCLHEAMNHCLETGGEHVAPDHFRLMMSCAEICQTSTNLMLIRSPFSSQFCRVCAEVCEACASNCEKLGMDECARTCRECAKSCREMAG